jgi:hypothetical protein
MKNRSEGWKHAKISGEKNEKLVALESNGEFWTNKKKVKSIFGDKTTPKPDLYSKTKNFSLKKSLGGQVHLNKVDRFIRGYEIIYGPIPANVKECFYLMFGGSNHINELLNNESLKHPNPKIRNTEIQRKTLCAETLEKYSPNKSEEFLNWLSDNIGKITEIVFKRGWAIDENQWASELLYKNKVDNGFEINETFEIDELINKVKNSKVVFGDKNGGTTIQLPFGHLQYHQNSLQFHHNYNKIKSLFTC